VFRVFQGKLVNGTVALRARPNDVAVEWDIYQISTTLDNMNHSVYVDLMYNGFFLANSFQGQKDCATGPPDVVVQPSDIFEIVFYNGVSGDLATAGIWYNENPTGTTYSTAH